MTGVLALIQLAHKAKTLYLMGGMTISLSES